MKYSLIRLSDSSVIRTKEFSSAPPTLPASKGVEWVPYIAPTPVPPSPQAQLETLTYVIKNHLNTKAMEYRYDNYHAALGYVGSPVHKFNVEGIAFRNWVSQVWVYAEGVEDDVRNGVRTIPTAQELIAELPAFVAPTY
jgi:hypothetical protein